ncbi:MAG: PD40 domain-containing protein, partial [Anaerolineae bacterium]|nr:PD40 domain-containing protein [Anaerolineae bacterium]
PTWSPDGQWVALVRRTPSNPDAQIWLMRPDGSEARPLTHQADTYYGVPAWSPDGNYLLLQQTELKGSRESEIWMIKIDTGELQSIGTGQLPNWLSD